MGKRFRLWLGKRDNYLSIIVIALALFLALYFIFVVPPNMDEYLPYHQIARYNFPNSFENSFREPTNDALDIVIFGWKLPLRSFHYCGVSEGWRYWPIYSLWSSYLSARFLRLLYLAIFFFSLWGITRLKPWLLGLLVLFNLPLVFNFLADTGPVAYQCALVLFLPYIFSRTYKSWGWSILWGLLLFSAFELKAIFMYLFFPLLFLSWYLLRDKWQSAERAERKKMFINAGIILAVALVPNLLIYSGQVARGVSYFSYLRQVGGSFPLWDIVSQAKHWWLYCWPFLSYFPYFGHRFYYTAFNFGALLSTIFIWVGSLLLIVFSARRRKEPGAKYYWHLVLIGLLFFGFLLWSINRMVSSANGHHWVLSFPFLLLALAAAAKILSKKRLKLTVLLLVSVAVLNIIGVFFMTSQPIKPENDWSRLEIMRQLNNPEVSRRYVYVIIDWGIYFMNSIYGPKDQIILYLEPLITEERIKSVENVAERRHLGVMFIGRNPSASDWELIKRHWPIQRYDYPGFVDRFDSWQMWYAKAGEKF